MAEASCGSGLGASSQAALADATVAGFQQVLLERLLTLDKEGADPGARTTRDFSPREWLELSKAVAELVSARRNLETLRREYEDRARRAAEELQKAAAKAEENAKDKGKSKLTNGVQVANAVRFLMGVPLPGESLPRATGQPERPALPAPADQPDSPRPSRIRSSCGRTKPCGRRARTDPIAPARGRRPRPAAG
jgi:hypothetical protein